MLALHLHKFVTASIAVFLLSTFSEGAHYDVGMHRFVIRDHSQQKIMKVTTTNALETPLFNRRAFQSDRKRVYAKYELAQETLQGLHLYPELDIPLVATFPYFDDPTAVFTFPANQSTAQSSGPILAPLPLPECTLPLTDFVVGGTDILYYGSVQIGTPPQTLSVDIDTGSADLWVSSNCTECNQKQFDPTKSSSYIDVEEDFSISYGTGDVLGSIAHETVSMAGLSFDNQTLGLVYSESHDFDGYPNSGILGLAFSTISALGEPTFFENLMIEKKVLLPFFSVHLSRREKDGSQVCFGCYDVTKTKGPVEWVPVKINSYWTVNMDGMRMNSTTMKTNAMAVIDTGTTFVYVPDDVAQEFYQTIHGAKEADQFGPGVYTFPCASKLDIAFQFGGLDFPINLRDFNLGKTAVNSLDCVGGVMSLGSSFPENIAIIGDEFLKSWYTVYDYSNGARVGFAPSINNLDA